MWRARRWSRKECNGKCRISGEKPHQLRDWRRPVRHRESRRWQHGHFAKQISLVTGQFIKAPARAAKLPIDQSKPFGSSQKCSMGESIMLGFPSSQMRGSVAIV
jgi:hypothetical protein